MGDNQIHCGEDAKKFNKIVEKYRSPSMAFALNILGNREDAEDVCQETFLQVFRNLENFDSQKKFKRWIYTVLYRRCLDKIRGKQRLKSKIKKLKAELSNLENKTPSNPWRKLYLSQIIMAKLSPKEKISLCLWANEEYSAKEIAEVLNCSSSTARVHLFNARNKIKNLMEKGNVPLQSH